MEPASFPCLQLRQGLHRAFLVLLQTHAAAHHQKLGSCDVAMKFKARLCLKHQLVPAANMPSMCEQAGAAHVYAIEMSAIAERAREIVQENGYADSITIIQGKAEDVQLPVEKVRADRGRHHRSRLLVWTLSCMRCNCRHAHLIRQLSFICMLLCGSVYFFGGFRWRVVAESGCAGGRHNQ